MMIMRSVLDDWEMRKVIPKIEAEIEKFIENLEKQPVVEVVDKSKLYRNMLDTAERLNELSIAEQDREKSIKYARIAMDILLPLYHKSPIFEQCMCKTKEILKEKGVQI